MAVGTYRANGASVREKLERGRDEFRHVRSDAGEIVDDLRVLAQKEVELMRAEMGEQVSHLTRAVIWGGFTAILALILLAFAFVSMMFAFDSFMPLWAAALVNTGIALALTAIAALLARSHIGQITVMPKRTMRSVQEDVRWAKDQLTSSAR
jgi:hypothetical protein